MGFLLALLAFGGLGIAVSKSNAEQTARLKEGERLYGTCDEFVDTFEAREYSKWLLQIATFYVNKCRELYNNGVTDENERVKQAIVAMVNEFDRGCPYKTKVSTFSYCSAWNLSQNIARKLARKAYLEAGGKPSHMYNLQCNFNQTSLGGFPTVYVLPLGLEPHNPAIMDETYNEEAVVWGKPNWDR